MMINNCQEIDILTKQRDELLPLLMNGQVSVNSDLAAILNLFFQKVLFINIRGDTPIKSLN